MKYFKSTLLFVLILLIVTFVFPVSVFASDIYTDPYVLSSSDLYTGSAPFSAVFKTTGNKWDNSITKSISDLDDSVTLTDNEITDDAGFCRAILTDVYIPIPLENRYLSSVVLTCLCTPVGSASGRVRLDVNNGNNQSNIEFVDSSGNSFYSTSPETKFGNFVQFGYSGQASELELSFDLAEKQKVVDGFSVRGLYLPQMSVIIDEWDTEDSTTVELWFSFVWEITYVDKTELGKEFEVIQNAIIGTNGTAPDTSVIPEIDNVMSEYDSVNNVVDSIVAEITVPKITIEQNPLEMADLYDGRFGVLATSLITPTLSMALIAYLLYGKVK